MTSPFLRRTAAILLAVAAISPAASAAENTAFEFHDGDRVTLLGGAFIVIERKRTRIRLGMDPPRMPRRPRP